LKQDEVYNQPHPRCTLRQFLIQRSKAPIEKKNPKKALQSSRQVARYQRINGWPIALVLK
jgi:hypothetical protein